MKSLTQSLLVGGALLASLGVSAAENSLGASNDG